MNRILLTGLVTNIEKREDFTVMTVSVKKLKKLPLEEAKLPEGTELPPFSYITTTVLEYYRVVVRRPHLIEMLDSKEFSAGQRYVSVMARMNRREPKEGERESDVNTYFVASNIKLLADIREELETNIGPYAKSATITQGVNFHLSGFLKDIYSPSKGVINVDIKVPVKRNMEDPEKTRNKFNYAHLYYFNENENTLADIFNTYRKNDYISVSGHLEEKRIPSPENENGLRRTFFVIDEFNVNRVDIVIEASPEKLIPKRHNFINERNVRKVNIYAPSPEEMLNDRRGHSEY
jgi:hypothetical protein